MLGDDLIVRRDSQPFLVLLVVVRELVEIGDFLVGINPHLERVSSMDPRIACRRLALTWRAIC